MTKLTFDAQDAKDVYMSGAFSYTWSESKDKLAEKEKIIIGGLLKRPNEDWWHSMFRSTLTANMGFTLDTMTDWDSAMEDLNRRFNTFKTALTSAGLPISEPLIFSNAQYAYTFSGDAEELDKLEKAIGEIVDTRDKIIGRHELWRHRRFRNTVTVSLEMPTQSVMSINVFRMWLEYQQAPVSGEWLDALVEWLKETNVNISSWKAFITWLRGQTPDLEDWDEFLEWLTDNRVASLTADTLTGFKTYLQHMHEFFLDTLDEVMMTYDPQYVTV